MVSSQWSLVKNREAGSSSFSPCQKASLMSDEDISDQFSFGLRSPFSATLSLPGAKLLEKFNQNFW